MKSLVKKITLAILLIGLSIGIVVPVLAQKTVSPIPSDVQRKNAPISPNILKELKDGESGAVFVGLDKLPYNLSVTLEKYQTDLYTYWIVDGTDEIVMISPNVVGIFYNSEPLSTMNTLETRARDFITLADNKIVLDELNTRFDNKGGITFFFRWTDTTSHLAIGEHPFVQVGYSIGGDFLTYINTFPFLRTSKDEAQNHPSLGIMAFNEVYANGGNRWGWLKTGSGYNTVNNDGYCYDAGWCSPKTVFWSFATDMSKHERVGMWRPNPNTSSLAAAYIPANNATHPAARYYVRDYYGESYKVVNQAIWYDTWISITSRPMININRIKVGTGNWEGSDPPKLAWDEVWVYDAPQ